MCRVGGDGHRNLCRSRVELKQRTFALAKTHRTHLFVMLYKSKEERVYTLNQSVTRIERKGR